jgi:hypothetical protein
MLDNKIIDIYFSVSGRDLIRYSQNKRIAKTQIFFEFLRARQQKSPKRDLTCLVVMNR